MDDNYVIQQLTEIWNLKEEDTTKFCTRLQQLPCNYDLFRLPLLSWGAMERRYAFLISILPNIVEQDKFLRKVFHMEQIPGQQFRVFLENLSLNERDEKERMNEVTLDSYIWENNGINDVIRPCKCDLIDKGYNKLLVRDENYSTNRESLDIELANVNTALLSGYDVI